MIQKMIAVLVLSLFFTGPAFAAGSSNAISLTEVKDYGLSSEAKRVKIVTIDWVADDADASVPDLELSLSGYLLKVVTNPGATAPTDQYDITFGDPSDSALDALGGALADRATATTEQVYPVVSGATTPIFLQGDYTLSLSNNAVNSASGQIVLYLVDQI